MLKSLNVLCVITQLQNSTPSVITESESMVFLTRLMKKHCYSAKSANLYLLLVKHMYRKNDSLVPKPNHECNLCDYTFSIKEVLAMRMHKEHNGAAPV